VDALCGAIDLTDAPDVEQALLPHTHYFCAVRPLTAWHNPQFTHPTQRTKKYDHPQALSDQAIQG